MFGASERRFPKRNGPPRFPFLASVTRLGEASVVAQLNAAEGQAQRPNINFFFFL
jgi:hypothetical protein